MQKNTRKLRTVYPSLKNDINGGILIKMKIITCSRSNNINAV